MDGKSADIYTPLGLVGDLLSVGPSLLQRVLVLVRIVP
jgi:hypothetical protein